jgi:uncharacterized protein (TIGR02466 family)
MAIELWFPTPIYFDMITGDAFDKIQDDFSRVYDDLIITNKFSKVKDWSPGTQSLSDTTFKNSMIDRYNLITFRNEIVDHVSKFINGIGNNKAESLQFVIKESWMTLTKKNEFAHTHDHYHADLSGVYYYQTTGEDGNLYFETPNKMLKTSFMFRSLIDRTVFKPEIGKIILFPGGLDHGVYTNTSDSNRISVSFNIYFDR